MSTDQDLSIVETRDTSHNSVVTLRMNRPKVKNALGPGDVAALRNALLRLQTDAQVKLIFITGTDEAFTGGADINELNDLSGDAMLAFIETQVDLLNHIVLSPKIIVAAVNGVSAGLGNHIIACCDLAFIKDTAVMHFTGASKALPSLLMGPLLMPMTIGLKRDKSLYLRGGKRTSQQAVDDGLCNERVDAADWQSHLDAIAAEFAGRSSATMAHNKYQLNQAAMQLIGASKLSGLAGAMALSQVSNISTGRVK